MGKVERAEMKQMYSHIFAGGCYAITIAFKHFKDNLIAYGVTVVAPADLNRASKAKGRAIAGARCNAAIEAAWGLDWDSYHGPHRDANHVLIEVRAQNLKKFSIMRSEDLKAAIRNLRAALQ